MTTLTIIDLPAIDSIDRDAMRAVRGGIAYLVNPDAPKLPGFPACFGNLPLPMSWPVSPARPAQDPRLL